MAFITLETTFTKNSSLQKGDQIYFLDTSGGDKRIGPVESIETNYLICTVEGSLNGLTGTS